MRVFFREAVWWFRRAFNLSSPLRKGGVTVHTTQRALDTIFPAFNALPMKIPGRSLAHSEGSAQY